MRRKICNGNKIHRIVAVERKSSTRWKQTGAQNTCTRKRSTNHRKWWNYNAWTSAGIVTIGPCRCDTEPVFTLLNLVCGPRFTGLFSARRFVYSSIFLHPSNNIVLVTSSRRAYASRAQHEYMRCFADANPCGPSKHLSARCTDADQRRIPGEKNALARKKKLMKWARYGWYGSRWIGLRTAAAYPKHPNGRLHHPWSGSSATTGVACKS